jgi:hypothetical protein
LFLLIRACFLYFFFVSRPPTLPYSSLPLSS